MILAKKTGPKIGRVRKEGVVSIFRTFGPVIPFLDKCFFSVSVTRGGAWGDQTSHGNFRNSALLFQVLLSLKGMTRTFMLLFHS